SARAATGAMIPKITVRVNVDKLISMSLATDGAIKQKSQTSRRCRRHVVHEVSAISADPAPCCSSNTPGFVYRLENQSEAHTAIAVLPPLFWRSVPDSKRLVVAARKS
ncbi:MAG: hypothetical protein WA633_13540, partial [Stellaceae bacterium]